ncbi:hypothetical protein JDV02_010854 [Purpureocillium takamizusanense]|uniref:Mid2 domain-containing protein n=1 Tax=Purpureocillium takamizusanense TaxID=2060973 RepID=A0A9Q8QHB3_9HYPO|nr:uncharacterized protein JDV02_010854 [Purpureocillium takamizusanense]UNI18884.1 hypothetical protein JDV02_010854 [Purpureocillium takamizusanense]
MTKPSRGPSLLQAREDARSHPHPHSLFHRHRQPGDPRATPQTHHEHHRYPHQAAADDGPCAEHEADDTAQASSTAFAHDIGGDVIQRDGASHAPGVDTVVNVIKDPGSPFVTRVVQTVSLVHVVDPWGSAWETQTVLGPPSTIVVDTSGNTVAVSAAGVQATIAAFGVTPSTAATTAPRSSDTGTTAPSTTISSQASSLTSAPSHSASIYPTISGLRNGTNTVVHGNSSFVHSNASAHRVSALSAAASLSFTSTSSDSSTSESLTATTTGFKRSTTSISAHSSTTTTSSSFSLQGGGFVATTLADGTQPSPTSDPGTPAPNNLTPQQKQVIGGVVGSIAGVAFFALLILLAIKYKRRRDGRQLIGEGHPGQTASRSISGGDGGPGTSRTMAERSGPSAAVTAALATLTGKRNANKAASPPEGTERGFYRVSGRKLTSVLHTGGDGYSDPRESTISGSSDYYRGSQSFDPATVQAGHLALGVPMRPVSGVPVMRSGPARVPVTENPFDDPTTPTSPIDMSAGNVASRESPRAQGSRFQEGI